MKKLDFKAFWCKDKVTTSVDTVEFLQGGIRVSDGCCHTGWEGKECVLREFTGIKDKNGKEIYKGDVIINHWCGVEQKLIVKIIEPQMDSTGWLVKRGGIEFERIDKTVDLKQLHPIYFEVIGNIYENPELLA